MLDILLATVIGALFFCVGYRVSLMNSESNDKKEDPYIKVMNRVAESLERLEVIQEDETK